MSWLQSQIELREELDEKLVQRAYAELASGAVRGHSYAMHFDEGEQIDAAVEAALKYCGARPGVVPEGVHDFDRRLECLCASSGAMYREVRLDGDWYKHAFGAMVATLKSGHRVALLPRGTRGYYYVDPETGHKVRLNAQTAPQLEEDALLFYRPLPSKALTVPDLIKFIFGTFDRNDYMLVLFAALAVTLVGMLPVWANQVVFGIVVPSQQVDLVLPLAVMLVGVAVAQTLIGVFRSLIMSRVSLKVNVAAEAATFARVLQLPPSFFKQYDAGNLAVRVSQVTTLASQLMSILLGSTLTAVLSLLYVVQIFMFTPVLALPALVVVLLEGAVTVAATILKSNYDRIAMDANAKTSGTITALLGGIQKIKLAGAENRAFSKWAHDFSGYVRAMYNTPRVVVVLPAVVSAIGAVGTVVIYFLAGSTGVALADFMAFNAAFGMVTGAIMQLAGMANQVAMIAPMAEMVAPILESVPETSDDKPSVANLSGAIEVSGVSFKYSPEGPYIVRDLSFKVKPGEYVALVGKSGCGKSTILRLLLGFEKAERGTITFGPHDVTKVNLHSLRSHVGTVMQDGKLFMGDIASNITISNPQATIDDAWEAAEVAGIADDIRKMPMGMQTLVTEGSGGMSGGQRQRIMIARAVCGNRRILMLDEATSALDNKTQRHVIDSLDALDCTRIVVAHRLSTVRHCDRILVVDAGQVVEEGTYEELIAKNGAFAELVARQRLEGEV